MSDVEAVEKPHFTRKILAEWRDPDRAIRHFIIGVLESPYRQRRLLPQVCFRLLRIPVMRQLLDVMHQTEELPLRIHLPLPA